MGVSSLTVPGGQEFNFPHFSLNFHYFFLFVLILAIPRVGESPTQEGPGHATASASLYCSKLSPRKYIFQDARGPFFNYSQLSLYNQSPTLYKYIYFLFTNYGLPTKS